MKQKQQFSNTTILNSQKQQFSNPYEAKTTILETKTTILKYRLETERLFLLFV